MTDEQFNELRGDLRQMQDAIRGTQEAIHGLDRRLVAIETRLDGFDHRFDNLEKRIDNSETRTAAQVSTVADKGYAYRAAITVNGTVLGVIALVATALRTFGFV